jgi:glycosyltransferase involved in cell wall biosynthesis
MSMRKIAFLLGGVEISGGINVIFQHGMHLAEKGYEVSFITNKTVYPSDIKWHPLYEYIREKNDCNITWYTFNELDNISFDVGIATWWRSFFNLWKVKARHYLYFVQSIESRFYPPNEIALRSVVESTYEMGVGFITECNWISRYLYDNYQHNVPVALNGIDKTIFNEDGISVEKRSPEKLRVLIEGPVDVPFKNVPGTINLVDVSSADESWLLTSSPVNEIKGVDRIFSKIPMLYTPTIYRSCDVIIKLSYVEGMFGPPLEMFHCGGTCIVYDVTGHDEYVKHKVNGIVVRTNAENEVINYLNELKENRDVLNKLKEGAMETAREWPDWVKSNDMFETALVKAMDHSIISHEMLKKYTKRIWHIYENKLY